MEHLDSELARSAIRVTTVTGVTMDPIERYARYLVSIMGKSPHAEEFSRRELFRLASRYAATGGVLAALLAACGNEQPTPAGGGSSSTGASSGGTSGNAATSASSGSPGSGTPSGGSAASPVSGKLPEITSIPENLKGSGEVRVIAWGGVTQDAERKAYYEPFERLSGIKVVEAEGPDVSKIKAMVDTGNVGLDVVELDRGSIMLLQQKGDYWEEIDYDLVDVDNIDEVYRSQYGLDMLPYAQTYAYRTDAFKGAKPQSWADVWDTDKFPGPRSLPSGSGGLTPDLEAATVAAGAAIDAVYPIDIDKAYDSLDKIKKDVVKWWTAGAQPVQMLANNEAVIVDAWNGRVQTIQKSGSPVEVGWNQGQLLRDAWGVPKGANRENAMKFVAFTTLAISQARLSMLIPYGFVNNKSVDYIPQDILASLPTSPEHKKLLFPHDSKWWSANRDEVVNRWNTWILS